MSVSLLRAFPLVLLVMGCSTDPHNQGPTNQSVSAKPAGTARAKLWLSAAKDSDAVTLTVNFERSAAPAPRIADIRIAHSESLTLKEATPGPSAAAAGKELTTQEPSPNIVRLILLSRDTNELQSGALAQITFAKAKVGEAKLDILMDSPVFAPVEAMQGLLIGDPLTM